MYRYLPASVATQYSEIVQQCVVSPAPDGSNISFKRKKIKGKTYCYLHISIGARRSEHYLGEETAELIQTIQKEMQLWESNKEDISLRSTLVSMMIAGGATSLLGQEGKVLGLLERSGIFLAGGVLVGTYAFHSYANMLGVVWEKDSRTKDIDLAREAELPVALPETSEGIDLKATLLDSGMGFFEVPALSRKSPSTAFKIRGLELSVELLTPQKAMHSEPVKITSLNTFAEPMRFIEYLLEDTQVSVLLYKQGILVNVPAPGRFALHKLVVSQRRPVAFASKAKKDLSQANALLKLLCDDRPGDIVLAYEAAVVIGGKFLKQMKTGFKRLEPAIQQELTTIIDI